MEDTYRGLRDQVLYLLVLGHIGLVRPVDGSGGQGGVDLGEASAIPSGQGDGGSLGCETARNGGADAAGGTCYEGMFALEGETDR
jgi:hypothetical protein